METRRYKINHKGNLINKIRSKYGKESYVTGRLNKLNSDPNSSDEIAFFQFEEGDKGMVIR